MSRNLEEPNLSRDTTKYQAIVLGWETFIQGYDCVTGGTNREGGPTAQPVAVSLPLTP